jgi:hypothetical protein
MSISTLPECGRPHLTTSGGLDGGSLATPQKPSARNANRLQGIASSFLPPKEARAFVASFALLACWWGWCCVQILNPQPAQSPAASLADDAPEKTAPTAAFGAMGPEKAFESNFNRFPAVCPHCAGAIAPAKSENPPAYPGNVEKGAAQ